MLQFDMDGRLIPPSAHSKTIGGTFDKYGLPANFSLPTTGDYVNTSTPDNGWIAKYLQRPVNTPGRSAAIGPILDNHGEIRAYNIRAAIYGGGSSAAQGITNLRVGLWDDSRSNGAFLEYLQPGNNPTGTFLTGMAGGVATRKPILMQVNNPGENYFISLWLARKFGGGWQLALGEGDGPISFIEDFAASEIAISSLRPIIDFELVSNTSAFSRKVSRLECVAYFDW